MTNINTFKVIRTRNILIEMRDNLTRFNNNSLFDSNQQLAIKLTQLIEKIDVSLWKGRNNG